MHPVLRPAGQLGAAQGQQLVPEPEAGHGRGAARHHQRHEHPLAVGRNPESDLQISVIVMKEGQICLNMTLPWPSLQSTTHRDSQGFTTDKEWRLVTKSWATFNLIVSYILSPLPPQTRSPLL